MIHLSARLRALKVIGLAIAAACAVGASAGTAPAANDTYFACSPSKSLLIPLPDSGTNTNSNAFSNLAGPVGFTQGGTKPGCVIITINAEMATGGPIALFMRAQLDQQKTHERQVLTSATDYANMSVSFMFTNVAPGHHSVRLSYRSSTNGQSVYVAVGNVHIQVAP